MIICSIVWKEVCWSDVVSVRSLVGDGADLVCLQCEVPRAVWWGWGFCDWVPQWAVWCGLLLVVGFLVLLTLPLIMFNKCFKVIIMSFTCIGAQCWSLNWFDTLVSCICFSPNNWCCVAKLVVLLFDFVWYWGWYVNLFKYWVMLCTVNGTNLWWSCEGETLSQHVLSSGDLSLTTFSDQVESREVVGPWILCGPLDGMDS